MGQPYPGQAEPSIWTSIDVTSEMEMVACLWSHNLPEVTNPDPQSLQKGGELIFIFLDLIDLLGPF
jgi:hypothetical protein